MLLALNATVCSSVALAAPGDEVGGEFLVNIETASGQSVSSVSMDADGDFVVAWESNLQDTDGFGVFAQSYNADGTTSGGELPVNTETANDQTKPSVALDANGDIVIAWTSDLQDGDVEGVYAQRYEGDVVTTQSGGGGGGGGSPGGMLAWLLLPLFLRRWFKSS